MFVNYKVTEQLYNGKRSLVQRAIRLSDQKKVIIKLLKSEFPSVQDLARSSREFEILTRLKMPEVVPVLSLEKYKNSSFLVFEDTDAQSLIKLLEGQNGDLGFILDIAIKMIEAIGKLHNVNIIHKDINPSNVISKKDGSDLRIIDFGICSELHNENAIVHNPNLLEGTLGYISPEQTGRMNHNIDYRTDYYTFGVTLYR